MSMSELCLVLFFFVNQFLLYIVFFLSFYISYMIFIYYSIVFPLVERFQIHEPLVRETG